MISPVLLFGGGYTIQALSVGKYRGRQEEHDRKLDHPTAGLGRKGSAFRERKRFIPAGSKVRQARLEL